MIWVFVFSSTSWPALITLGAQQPNLNAPLNALTFTLAFDIEDYLQNRGHQASLKKQLNLAYPVH